MQSIAAIPEMIKRAVFIEERENRKGNGKFDSYRYYVVGLKIDGVNYTAKLVVGVKNGSRFYDHRLSEIEKGTLIDNLNGLSNTVAENQSSSVSDVKGMTLDGLLQTNSSKIVDENGEPMLELNRIKTVFGRDRYVVENGERILAWDKNITPEQEALLRGHNYREYPTIQELSAAKVVENFKNPEVLSGKSDKAEDKRKAVDILAKRYGLNIRVEENSDEITDADGDKNFTR